MLIMINIVEKNINFNNIYRSFKSYKNKPFNFTVINNFFKKKFARNLEGDFPSYNDKIWYSYSNQLENKKALNNWNAFPELTYSTFSYLCSDKFIKILSNLTSLKLYPDYGLNGGGWHIHGKGGNLNPHLDYSIHPKILYQRKINIIIYLSENLLPSKHKGHLGFWEHDKNKNQPGQLIHEIEPQFNRAVILILP